MAMLTADEILHELTEVAHLDEDKKNELYQFTLGLMQAIHNSAVLKQSKLLEIPATDWFGEGYNAVAKILNK